MKKHIGLILLLSMPWGHAQNIERVQKEIEQNLWKSFKSAFENLDAEKLNSLYAEEVLRATPNGIDTENNYKKANIKRLTDYKKNHTNLQLDFWFDNRHTNVTTSYEVGFYRMILSNTDGVSTIYWQFHIVLNKSAGRWKITQDWDTGSINGQDLSKQDFEKKRPIQFD